MWMLRAGSLTDILVGVGIRLFIIFAILPLHECAHALAAYKLGDHTAKSMGRLTLNPLAHLDWVGAACIMFIGFGWAKPVPVNPVNFDNQRKRQRGMAITAFAGPLSNFLVAVFFTIIFRLLCSFSAVYEWQYFSYIVDGLYLLIFINLGLAIFNLLPFPPLDGSRILNWILPDRWVYKLEEFMRRYGTIVTIAMMALLFSGYLSTPISWLEGVIFRGVWNGASFIFNLIGLTTPYYV